MIDSRVEALLRSLNEQGVTGICTRCPVCERAGKFSVNFRDGLALYCCHRPTCGVRGVYAIAGAANAREVANGRAFTPRPLTAEYRLPLPGDHWWHYVEGRLGVPRPNVIHDWCLQTGFRVLHEDPDTAVWELRGFQREDLGHVTRTLDKRIQSWFVRPPPRYGFWPGADERQACLIVEDPMSAALYPGPAVALLGTHMSREMAQECAHFDYGQRWHVALDADAMNAAKAVADRLRAAGLEARIVPISRDVKDMTPAERTRLYEDVTL